MSSDCKVLLRLSVNLSVTQTIPLAIYDYTNTPGGEQGAMVLCLISIGISYLMLLLNEGLRRRWHRG